MNMVQQTGTFNATRQRAELIRSQLVKENCCVVSQVNSCVRRVSLLEGGVGWDFELPVRYR